MSTLPFSASPLLPAAFMAAGVILSQWPYSRSGSAWRILISCSIAALVTTLINVLASEASDGLTPWLRGTPLALWCAVLVQLLGTVIACFSARYLEGEPGQRRYVAALGSVLVAVQLLLLADHWLVLIGAWALVGSAMQPLLCFYRDRPFALLAGHKKRIADRSADLLLVCAALLAWHQAGNGSLPALWACVAREGMTPALQLSALLLALAVVLRSALLPVHGWLIQVMEAPTPVSALLHAGVVNLGGFVLIRFAPLLDQALAARLLLVAFGLGTAILAGFVMLTRISIKVRLAWSTVAQMGFMVLECGLGLYTLAALHLIGHSLYKAHAFLSASMVVRQTRRQALEASMKASAVSLALAPAAAVGTVLILQAGLAPGAWPWWWSIVMGLAWAPLLWMPVRARLRTTAMLAASGMTMVVGLCAAALLVHFLPLGLRDAPADQAGLTVVVGMTALYLFLAALQAKPQAFGAWRRWAYAGFYVDEIYTRIALRLGKARWMPGAQGHTSQSQAPLAPANASH